MYIHYIMYIHDKTHRFWEGEVYIYIYTYIYIYIYIERERERKEKERMRGRESEREGKISSYIGVENLLD